MRATRSVRDPAVIRTGYGIVPFPGLPYVIRGSLETQNMPPARNLVPATNDTVLYVFTPMRIRMNAPGRPWLACDANTALLMPNHNYYLIDTTVTREKGHHCWFTFEDLFYIPLYQLAQNETGLARFRDPDGTLGAQMRALVATVQRDREAAFWPMQYQGRNIMDALYAATRLEPGLYEVGPGGSEPEAPLVPRVTGYFLQNLGTPLDLATIAKALHVSKSTLSHAYSKETGESPMHTLRRMRLHQVKVLLLQNLTLAAIAELTGFYDAHHLSREFRRAEGLSPSRFLDRGTPHA
jgi:AraC-like DNA-binding protein